MRVIVTAGSDEKCRRCLAHGADDAINYRTEDFAQRAQGVDIILDHLGAPYIARDLQALATGGRLVMIGSMGGRETVPIDVAAVLAKRQQIIGSTLRARPAAEKAAIVAAFIARFGADLEAGRIRPVIDSTFPLERAIDAHKRMAEDHFGKIAIAVSTS
jgi:NADPH2:quinone reductase